MTRHTRMSLRGLLATALASLALGGCGGDAGPTELPPIANPDTPPGPRLSYAYFQRCVYPILTTPIVLNTGNGVTRITTCSASGCHGDAPGTGGALKIEPVASPLQLLNPLVTVADIRASPMYRSFLSAERQARPRNPDLSPLVTKPLEQNIAHVGGKNFNDALDPGMRRILYWINNPAGDAQDEFNPSTYAMFTPANPDVGNCNTQ